MTPITQSHCAATQWSRWSRWHCKRKFRLKTFDMGHSDFLVSQLTFKSTAGTYCHPAVCLQVFKGTRSRSTFFLFGHNYVFWLPHVQHPFCHPCASGTMPLTKLRWDQWRRLICTQKMMSSSVTIAESWLIAMFWGTPSDKQHDGSCSQRLAVFAVQLTSNFFLEGVLGLQLAGMLWSIF